MKADVVHEARTHCEHCNKKRVCRRVRKPKRQGQTIVYPFVWLCAECVYNEEIL